MYARRLFSRFVLACAVGAMVPGGSRAQSFVDVGSLQTRAERTDYRETSRYDDVTVFLQTVANASPAVHLTDFGYSFEGRALPLAVVGDATAATPQAVLASGKTRVFVQANIHAGEVCGKEAMLMLLRDVARGVHAEWMDSLVLLIAPIYNADGNERVRLTNRPRQHGPIGGMGQRANAQGYDLNRDHMKMDSPEARSLVGLMNEYDPHVAIDLHTTNGSRHGYHLTYAPPLHPNTDHAITSLLRSEWLPFVSAYLERTEGWYSYYYGNAFQPEGAPTRGWFTFDHRPRFNNNYVGLRNRFAILSEAYSYATFEERVAASLRFVEGAIEYAYANAARLQRTVREADTRDLNGEELALRATFDRSATPVEILMGEVDEERNPYSGGVILRRRDVTRRESMDEYYLVPTDLSGVLEKLAAHGVQFSHAQQDLRIDVEEFRIDSTAVSAREFQQHRERTLFGAYRHAARTLSAGTVVVPTNQPLGRLAFYLLEPRSDDGFVNWNVLDEALEGASVYPVLRTFEEF
jgi:hypothetical protein